MRITGFVECSKPDFIDLALSNDLGYIYGSYIYTTTDWIGVKNVVKSAFHAVWKRQSDGKWKFEELNGCLIIIVLYPRWMLKYILVKINQIWVKRSWLKY